MTALPKYFNCLMSSMIVAMDETIITGITTTETQQVATRDLQIAPEIIQGIINSNKLHNWTRKNNKHSITNNICINS